MKGEPAVSDGLRSARRGAALPGQDADAREPAAAAHRGAVEYTPPAEPDGRLLP